MLIFISCFFKLGFQYVAYLTKPFKHLPEAPPEHPEIANQPVRFMYNGVVNLLSTVVEAWRADQPFNSSQLIFDS